MIGDIIALCWALVVSSPDVPPARACAAAVPIVLAAGDRVDPVLVAAISYRESRYLWRADNGRCRGPMQVAGPMPRTELAGYQAGVAKLVEARAWCIRRRTPGSLCTLAVYASGPRGARERLYRGPRAVLARAARIRREVARLAPVAHPAREGASS